MPEPPVARVRPPGLHLSALASLVSDPKVRASVFGYFGHMWELYTLWVLMPLILATRLQGKKVRVTLQHKDTYDRWLARIDGPDGDVGAWLVGRGHAWSMRWRDHPGPYAVQETAARKARRGLFAEARPEPPRDFSNYVPSAPTSP